MRFSELFNLKVVLNSNRNELKEEGNQFKLYLKAVPEKGKANKEIIRFFKKKYNLKIEIVKGEKSRNKVIKII